jgi:ribosomal protein S18 acetylase RimI-like enzyme
MPVDFVAAVSRPQLEAIASLARTIWYEHYVPIIGRAQVDYMVAKYQSFAAMQEQVDNGYEYFLVRRDSADAGYLALREEPADDAVFISKLYLRRDARGSGTGRTCLEFIQGLARQRGLRLLWLTVNKANPAVTAYERLGFAITDAIVMDIGNGFVMDDFRMEKRLDLDRGSG